MQSKKFNALSALLTSAGFDVDALLNAGEEANPVQAAIESAKAASVAAVLAELEIEQGDHDSPAAAIEAHYDAAHVKAEAERSSYARSHEALAAAVEEVLGVDVRPLEADSLSDTLAQAVTRKTAAQLAAAGHEPVAQPPGGDDVTEIDVMDIESARRALLEETDPERYKRIYNRIQQIKASGRN